MVKGRKLSGDIQLHSKSHFLTVVANQIVTEISTYAINFGGLLDSSSANEDKSLLVMYLVEQLSIHPICLW